MIGFEVPIMPLSFSEVARHATRLPQRQRMKLVSTLLKMPDDNSEKQLSVDKAWDKEIKRRLAEVRSGKARMVPWEEVKRGIEKKLAK